MSKDRFTLTVEDSKTGYSVSIFAKDLSTFTKKTLGADSHAEFLVKQLEQKIENSGNPTE